MSKIETKTESFGHLYGLFGVTGDCSADEEVATQTEEGEICETDDLHTKREQIDQNRCVICQSSQIKYRCPKCELKTCSLHCCNRHKARYSCDGIRNRLSFVKMSDFSQSEFLSDYFFLEEVDRTLDNSAREKRAIISSKAILPKWIQKLVREARFRGITLRIMPAGFQRRKQNTTCFMYSQKTINWDIEVKFVNAINLQVIDKSAQLSDQTSIVSQSEVCFLKHRVCENTKLSDIISELIESKDSTEKNRKLDSYRKTGPEGIHVLFRDESRTSKRKYYELDVNKSIKDNLKDKTVIEFPTFLVVLSEFKHTFDCFDRSPIKSESDSK